MTLPRSVAGLEKCNYAVTKGADCSIGESQKPGEMAGLEMQLREYLLQVKDRGKGRGGEALLGEVRIPQKALVSGADRRPYQHASCLFTGAHYDPFNNL